MPTDTEPTLEIGTHLGTAENLAELAGNIEAEERVRYQGGLQDLVGAYRQSQDVLGEGIDGDLLYSRAADASGARAKRSLASLRRSIGGRGISPNSGAAGGMLSRLVSAQQGEMIGAKRDIAIENQRQRQVNAAVNFQNALNLANYRNSPVSGAMLETSQNVFEGNIAREGIAAQYAAQRAASKDRKAGEVGGGLSRIVTGGFL